MTAPFLSIRGIRKTYGETIAVEDVSLDIAEGEFVTFLGPSGSGKSTTLYVIAGFMLPSSGDVLLKGRSLLGVPPNQRNIGMVFQRYTLFPHLTVWENVAFPLRVRNLPRRQIETKVDAMLKLVRLERFRDRMPAALSGGQQQRVALARALAYDPPILLMDEPLSALDKKLREDLQAEIKRVHVETGVTILYVTHDQEEALRLSDRIALFNHGKIEQVGTGRELYDNPRSRFVGGFIGNSNFLPARVIARKNGTASVACPDGLTLEDVPVICQQTDEGEAALMVRPERIWVERADDPSAGPGLIGMVSDASFLGESMQYTVVTRSQHEIVARVPLSALRDRPASAGETVRLRWEREQARVFAPA